MRPLNAYVSEKRRPTSVGGAFVPHGRRVSVIVAGGAFAGAAWADTVTLANVAEAMPSARVGSACDMRVRTERDMR